jgi:hypothetical protein
MALRATMIKAFSRKAYKSIRIVLTGLALLGLSACVSPPQKKDFSALQSDHPRSIVIVPVTNSSTQVDTADNFLVTLPVPLAEKGYYVFPIHMVKRVMEDEGLADADLVHSADATKVASLFGADAVLFANIQRWDSRYMVFSTTTTVNIDYTLKSGKTGRTLWQDSVQTVYSPQAQNSGGHPYHPSVFHASHRGGRGRQAWRILTMRRRPRVNQDVLPRATFLG